VFRRPYWVPTVSGTGNYTTNRETGIVGLNGIFRQLFFSLASLPGPDGDLAGRLPPPIHDENEHLRDHASKEQKRNKREEQAIYEGLNPAKS
jgi:hypothetical protein